MFKSLVFALLLASTPAQSMIDPFTVLKGTEEGLSIVGDVFDKANDVSGAVGSVADLYGEIDSEAQVDAEMAAYLREVQEARRLANGVRGETGALFDVLADRDVEGFQGNVERMTSAIRRGKSIHNLFRSAEQKAQASQIANEKINQEIALSNRQQQIREERRELAKQKDALAEKKKSQEALDAAAQGEGIRSAQEISHGVYQFPIDEAVLEKGRKVAATVIPNMKVIMLSLFLVTVVVQMAGFMGSTALLMTLKGVLVAMVAFIGFPLLVEFMLAISQKISVLSLKIDGVSFFEANKEKLTDLDFVTHNFLKIVLLLRDILVGFLELVTTVGLSAVVAFAPILLTIKFVTGLGISFGSLMTLSVFLSLLPLLANLIGTLVVYAFGAQDSVYLAAIVSFLAPVFQIGLPMKMFLMFGGPAAGAMAAGGEILKSTGLRGARMGGSAVAGVTGFNPHAVEPVALQAEQKGLRARASVMSKNVGLNLARSVVSPQSADLLGEMRKGVKEKASGESKTARKIAGARNMKAFFPGRGY